ncbi:MAG: 4'-phosphopantetheinyl transferase superfamily protein [Marinagarivorans sp.]|nr:4'-phosphopantetheinyl transferase superfamily protein [Marinagarivorans sp.]
MTILHLHHIPTLSQQIPWQQALQSLDASEQNSAAKIKAERRLQEFVYGRHCLKTALAKHIGATAAELQLLKHPQGKLYLAGNPTFFNLSHSGEYLAYFIHDDCEVGLDIEHVSQRSPDLAGIAERYFCAAEQLAIKTAIAQSEADAKRVFYKIWTLKEATLKALGTGLNGGLDQLDTHTAAEGQVHRLANESVIFYHYPAPLGLESVFLSAAFLSATPQTKPLLR